MSRPTRYSLFICLLIIAFFSWFSRGELLPNDQLGCCSPTSNHSIKRIFFLMLRPKGTFKYLYP